MPKKSASKSVLIAEDEQALARVLTLKLRKEGFAVTTVYDGRSVLNAVGKGKYDLLLLDLIMPTLDGWEVLNRLREMKLSLPIIITSNLSKPIDIAKAKELGAVQYLIKSDVSLADIVKAVITALAAA